MKTEGNPKDKTALSALSAPESATQEAREGALPASSLVPSTLSPLAAFAAGIAVPAQGRAHLSPQPSSATSGEEENGGSSSSSVAEEGVDVETTDLLRKEVDAMPAPLSSDEVKLTSDEVNQHATPPTQSNETAQGEENVDHKGDRQDEEALVKAEDSEDLGFLDDSGDDEQRRDSGTGPDEAGAYETDDVYGKSSDEDAQTTHQSQLNGRIRLPKASEIELFHCVLVRDAGRLEEILQGLSPIEVLGIRDCDERTLYHYGALCTDHAIQSIVLGHVNHNNERWLASQIDKIMKEKGVVENLLSKKGERKREWIPPSVKELTQKSTAEKKNDWEAISQCVDHYKRSILHYAAAAPWSTVIQLDPVFIEVIRARRDIVCARDVQNKMPLHIAAEAGNIQAIKWYFSIGVQIHQEDVRTLLRLNPRKIIQDVLLHQLERRDIQAYRARQQDGSVGDSKSEWNIGLGTLARAELTHARTGPRDKDTSSLLLDAAKYGHLQSVELLLRQGASPRVCDSNGWTPLHVCADQGTKNHIEIAKVLLGPPYSVAVDPKSLKGRTPLHIAVKSRQLEDRGGESSSCREMISTLCHYGADTGALDRRGHTPLHVACRVNKISALEMLMSANCNLSAVDYSGRNGLHLAALRGNIEVIRFMISWEEGTGCLSNAGDNRGRTPIEVARNEKTRQQLISKWSLCYHGNVDGIKIQLSRLAQEVKPTRVASDGCFVSDTTMRSLRTPLHLAIQGYFDLLQSSDPPKPRRAPRLSTQQLDSPRIRYLQLVLLLLRAGADPDANDKWGITPIMIAAAIDDEQLLETLLESQTSASRLQATDQDGNTALHYSYAFCTARTSSILEDMMDEEEVTNNSGKTPFEITGLRYRVFPAGFRAHHRAVQAVQPRTKA